jgi:hypothetical protein
VQQVAAQAKEAPGRPLSQLDEVVYEHVGGSYRAREGAVRRQGPSRVGFPVGPVIGVSGCFVQAMRAGPVRVCEESPVCQVRQCQQQQERRWESCQPVANASSRRVEVPVAQRRTGSDEVMTVAINPNKGHQLRSGGRVFVDDTARGDLPCRRQGHGFQGRSWKFFGCRLDRADETETNALESESRSNRGEVTVGNNNRVGHCPRLHQIEEDIAAVEMPVDESGDKLVSNNNRQ